MLMHCKDLIKGDILIDDRPNNGAAQFDGEWIQLRSETYSNRQAVLNYLL
jgi:5'(3')-deoxyribonucleotidase